MSPEPLNYSWLPGDALGGYQVDGSAWINYSYYPSGDLHTIQRQGDANPFEYTYLLSGARAALQMSNGSRVDYTWDNLSRLLTLTNLDPVGALISRYSYQYDQDWSTGAFTKKGLRVAMTEDLPAGSTGMEKYYFDSLYQLTRADYPDGHHDDWTYDRIGNRLSAAAYVPGADPVLRNYSYYPNGHGGNSQLLQSDGVDTCAWDANGNLQMKSGLNGTSSYGWNSRNLLTTVTNTNLQASYVYDFLSRRVERTVGAEMTSFQYLAWDTAREISAGNVTDYIFGWNVDEPLQLRVGTTDYFYAADALGSVRQVLSSDGQVMNSYTYDAWGDARVLSFSIPNSFLFSGREKGEDGLLAYRMRHYDPKKGRFVSPDRLGFGSGDISFYRYVLNRPTYLTDPTGMDLGDYWDIRATVAYYDNILDTTTSPLEAVGASLAKALLDVSGVVEAQKAAENAGEGNYKCATYFAAITALKAASLATASSGLRSLPEWSENPALYELGSKTLPKAAYDQIAHLTPIERGRWLWNNRGIKSLLPSGGLRDWGATLGQGPTPGGWMGLMGLAQASPGLGSWILDQFGCECQ